MLLDTVTRTRLLTTLLALLTVTALTVPQAMAAPALNDATVTLNLAEFAAGDADDLAFVFTTETGVLNSVLSTLRITIPGGWTQPQTTSSTAAGYLTTANDGCQSGPTIQGVTGSALSGWVVAVQAQCGIGDTFTLTYSNPVPAALGTSGTLSQVFSGTLSGAGGDLDLLFGGGGTGYGTAPLQPEATTLTAVAGDGQVGLSWPAADEPVTGYALQRRTTVDGAWAALGTPGDETYLSSTDTGVANGSTYWYRVVTLNPVGQAFSEPVSATPQVAAPGAPTLASATAGDANVDLVWSAPTTGGAVASYTVQRAPVTEAVVGTYSDLSTGIAASTLQLSDDTALNDTTYSYRVLAVNATDSTESNALQATPTAGNEGGCTESCPEAPGAPTLTSATAGDGVVDLAWTAPTTGGAVVTYTVQRAPVVAAVVGDYANLATGLLPTTLLYSDLTAVNGATYSYRVAAVNAEGSTESNALQATPAEGPGENECTVDCPGEGDCTVDCPGEGDCTVDCPGEGDCTVDCPGEGDCTVDCPLPAPGAPTLVSATAGDASVNLVWAAPAAGGAVASYTVQRAPVVAAVVGEYAGIATGLAAATLLYADLTAVNGATYSYRVVAVNATASTPSNALQATPAAAAVVPGNGAFQDGGGAGTGGELPVPTPTTPSAPGRRCLPGQVPSAGFRDVRDGDVHEVSIDCIAWHGVTSGVRPRRYGPALSTTRGQMASFLDRAITASGTSLPAGRDRYRDDNGSVHEDAINRLAEAGIVTGLSGRRFGPNRPVRRDQLATMLVRTYAYLSDRQLGATKDHFVDDNGNLHEVYINIATDLGLALGMTDDVYGPNPPLRRDQMASFITRLLELLAGENRLNTPQ